MAEYILVLNLGSSSLKFTLYDINEKGLVQLVSGNAENIANPERSQIKIKDCSGKSIVKIELHDQKDAIIATFDELDKKLFSSRAAEQVDPAKLKEAITSDLTYRTALKNIRSAREMERSTGPDYSGLAQQLLSSIMGGAIPGGNTGTDDKAKILSRIAG